jgi:hypothetical protein
MHARSGQQSAFDVAQLASDLSHENLMRFPAALFIKRNRSLCVVAAGSKLWSDFQPNCIMPESSQDDCN